MSAFPLSVGGFPSLAQAQAQVCKGFISSVVFNLISRKIQANLNLKKSVKNRGRSVCLGVQSWIEFFSVWNLVKSRSKLFCDRDLSYISQ